MTQSQSQGKNWCFTLNNYWPEEYATLLDLDAQYVCIGKEFCPTTGTPHLQGFVVFHTNKRLSAVKKIHPTAHWELCKGSAESNDTYCKKGGEYEVRGVLPLTRKEVGAKNKELWADVIRSAEQGTAKQEYPEYFVRYNATLSRLYAPSLEDLPEYTGMWYYGPPGTGKSLNARKNYPGAYDKLLNKWWDGYNHEENVIIDDLSLDNQKMGTFLKRYADHYPFRAEYKGGSMRIRPKAIIVTSNYTPEEIWSQDPQLVLAIRRRYKMVRFDAQFPVKK